MTDGDVDAALQHGDVVLRKRPSAVALKSRSKRSAIAAASAASKSVRGHLVDVDDESRHWFQPREEGIVGEELSVRFTFR
jgi:hypothetical protein